MMINLDQELIRSFNCENYMKGIILTNCIFAVGERHEDHYVTMRFDKDTNVQNYFRDLRKHIIEAFHANEAGAKTCFYLNSFPFVVPNSRMCERERDGTVIVKFPITKEVRSNLKCHLINSIKKQF